MSRQVRVLVDGELVYADDRFIGWVVRRRVGLRRRWFGVGLYSPRRWTEPHTGQFAAACDLVRLICRDAA